MIFLYIIFIVLLFVVVIQYFQFKNKKRPTSILFISLFVISIGMIFFIQKNIKSLDININMFWVKNTIWLLLGITFLSIVLLKYRFLKNKKQQNKVDQFWMYQSFSLVIFILLGLAYLYYIQVQKTNLQKQYFKQSIFVKNAICYADSLCTIPINYTITPPQKILQMNIRSMDMVYRFSIHKLEKTMLLIPQKNISFSMDTHQDTIYFFAEW